jgi:hypothetical protein
MEGGGGAGEGSLGERGFGAARPGCKGAAKVCIDDWVDEGGGEVAEFSIAKRRFSMLLWSSLGAVEWFIGYMR